MRKTSILLLACLLIACCATAQVRLRFGPEVGYGYWGLAQADEFTDSYQSYKTSKSAGASFLLGANALWKLGRHWQVEHGLEFQNAEFSGTGFIARDYATPYGTRLEYDQRYRLQQLVMPVTGGYGWGQKHICFSLHVGARLGYIVAGWVDRDWEFTVWRGYGPKPEPIHEKGYFMKGHPQDRLHAQLLWRMQLEVVQRIFVSLNVAHGLKQITFEGRGFGVPRTMVTLSLGYRPFAHRFGKAQAE